jgi:hypothetical protein
VRGDAAPACVRARAAHLRAASEARRRR